MTGTAAHARTAWHLGARRATVSRLMLGAAALAALPVIAQAQPFEGIVTMRMSARGAQGPVAQESEMFVRGGRVRLQLKSAPGGMAMITVPREKKVYALMTATRSYGEMSLEAPSSSAPSEDVKVVRTGRKTVVAGLSCEHVAVTTANGASDVCVTTELSLPLNALDPMGRGTAAPWQQAVGEGAFPLKVTLADGSVPLEVIAVERKRLAPELFSVPADYKKMTLPTPRSVPPRPPAR